MGKRRSQTELAKSRTAVPGPTLLEVKQAFALRRSQLRRAYKQKVAAKIKLAKWASVRLTSAQHASISHAASMDADMVVSYVGEHRERLSHRCGPVTIVSEGTLGYERLMNALVIHVQAARDRRDNEERAADNRWWADHPQNRCPQGFPVWEPGDGCHSCYAESECYYRVHGYNKSARPPSDRPYAGSVVSVTTSVPSVQRAREMSMIESRGCNGHICESRGLELRTYEISR